MGHNVSCWWQRNTHTHTLTTVALENVNDTVLMLMQCWPYICPDAEIRWASVHRLVWSQCGAPYQCHTNTHFALSSHSMPLALVTLTLGGCRCVFDTLHLADFQSSGENWRIYRFADWLTAPHHCNTVQCWWYGLDWTASTTNQTNLKLNCMLWSGDNTYQSKEYCSGDTVGFQDNLI